MYGYVSMSNHVSLMVRAGRENLFDGLRDFKKFTASQILKKIIHCKTESRKEWLLKRFEFAAQRPIRKALYQFWTYEDHAVELIRNKFIKQKLMCI